MDNCEILLSKEADYLLCVLYKEYISLRKNKVPKSRAKYFSSSADIHKKFMPEAIYEDVDDTCKELHNANMLLCVESDFEVLRAELTDEAIVYMENRYKNNLKALTSHIIELAKIILCR